MSASADWTQLPKELLAEISSHLVTQFDNLRIRSICTAWRSAIPTHPSRFPARFPILPNTGISDSTWGFHLTKRTVYLLIRNPSWLLKIEHNSRPISSLYHPLARARLPPLPDTFPRVIDTRGIRVLELGQEFVMQCVNYRPLASSFTDAGNLYMEKVVFRLLGNGVDEGLGDFVVLTIHVSGKLAVFRSGEKKWSLIQDMPSPYDDVILYEGGFYAVDNRGRTVLVLIDGGVVEVGKPVYGGDKKYLVESDGELLLVDMYLSIDGDDDDNEDGREGAGGDGEEELLERFDYCIGERTVRFKVYRLDREGKEWNEVKDLGDKVLFLGDDCTFSASVAGISGLKENCIFFTDNYVHMHGDDQGELKGLDICMFDMETGKIEPLESFPNYSKLFWPPPDNVTSDPALLQVQNHLDELAL